jgi:hypothetical protein
MAEPWPVLFGPRDVEDEEKKSTLNSFHLPYREYERGKAG